MSEHLRAIRNAWISAMITEDPDQYYDAITEEQAVYAWDAALAAHNRKVKAEALREAAEEAANRWSVKPYVDRWLHARADLIEPEARP